MRHATIYSDLPTSAVDGGGGFTPARKPLGIIGTPAIVDIAPSTIQDVLLKMFPNVVHPQDAASIASLNRVKPELG